MYLSKIPLAVDTSLDRLDSTNMNQLALLGVFKLMLNEVSNQPEDCPAFIGEAYGCVNRLKDLRSDLLSTIQTTFSLEH
jgi:hypothetical protein